MNFDFMGRNQCVVWCLGYVCFISFASQLHNLKVYIYNIECLCNKCVKVGHNFTENLEFLLDITEQMLILHNDLRTVEPAIASVTPVCQELVLLRNNPFYKSQFDK